MRPTLAPDIFDHPNGDEPRLREHVRAHIIKKIDELRPHVEVIDFAILGSILSYQYNDSSDVDINVLIKPGPANSVLGALLRKMNGTMVPGTFRPLNFYFMQSREKFEIRGKTGDGLFDILQNRFTYRADHVEVDVNIHMKLFRMSVRKVDLMIDDLRDDLIDYEQLKTYGHRAVSRLGDLIKKEIQEIEDDVLRLIKFHDQLYQDRTKVFVDLPSREDIIKYGKTQAFPANVVYKLLERAQYITFFRKIEEIIGKDRKLSPDEADRLVKAVA